MKDTERVINDATALLTGWKATADKSVQQATVLGQSLRSMLVSLGSQRATAKKLAYSTLVGKEVREAAEADVVAVKRRIQLILVAALGLDIGLPPGWEKEIAELVNDEGSAKELIDDIVRERARLALAGGKS